MHTWCLIFLRFALLKLNEMKTKRLSIKIVVFNMNRFFFAVLILLNAVQ